MERQKEAEKKLKLNMLKMRTSFHAHFQHFKSFSRFHPELRMSTKCRCHHRAYRLHTFAVHTRHTNKTGKKELKKKKKYLHFIRCNYSIWNAIRSAKKKYKKITRI